MKKTIKFLTTCFVLMFIFSVNFFMNEGDKISAVGNCNNFEGTQTPDGKCRTGDSNDDSYIEIYKNGDIVAKYHQITEILIYAGECLDEDCETFGKKVIVHASGEKSSGAKNIYLSNYFVNNTRVRVKMIYTFNPVGGAIYCNITKADLRRGVCNDLKDKKANDVSVNARIKALFQNEGNSFEFEDGNWKDNVKVELLDNNHLVLAGVDDKPELSFNQNVDTVVIIDNEEAKKVMSSEVENMIYDTIIPVLLTVLGIAATVAVVLLGYQIIKTSDEPQERAEKIAKLKNILVGLVLAFGILIAAEPIMEFVERWLE